VSMLEELTGMNPPVVSSQTAPDPLAPEHSVADVAKLHRATPFQGRTSLRDSLRAMLESAGCRVPPM